MEKLHENYCGGLNPHQVLEIASRNAQNEVELPRASKTHLKTISRWVTVTQLLLDELLPLSNQLGQAPAWCGLWMKKCLA